MKESSTGRLQADPLVMPRRRGRLNDHLPVCASVDLDEPAVPLILTTHVTVMDEHRGPTGPLQPPQSASASSLVSAVARELWAGWRRGVERLGATARQATRHQASPTSLRTNPTSHPIQVRETGSSANDYAAPV